MPALAPEVVVVLPPEPELDPLTPTMLDPLLPQAAAIATERAANGTHETQAVFIRAPLLGPYA